MNSCFQTEASIAEKDFKLKDLELKTIYLFNILTYIHLTWYNQYGPILVFIKSERLMNYFITYIFTIYVKTSY